MSDKRKTTAISKAVVFKYTADGILRIDTLSVNVSSSSRIN